MTDYAGIALIITAIGTMLTALTGIGAMLLTWRTHSTVRASADNIQKIETATNSMKDALVLATGKAEHAAGRAQGQAEGAAAADGQPSLPRGTTTPVPVADDRTAVATERTAAASERVASAAERSADVSEKK